MNERGEPVEIVAEELPASFDRHIQSWDLAFEGKATSDFTAALDIGVSGAKRYILDTVHARLDFTETIAAIDRARLPSPFLCHGTKTSHDSPGQTFSSRNSAYRQEDGGLT
jgi:hypothetical protein